MARTIEYVLPEFTHTKGHALGVTVLTRNAAGVLYSGGRDGRIVAWACPESKPYQIASEQAHTNWITGLASAGHSIASCSNDTTVNLWNESLSYFTKLGNHSDYATALTIMKPQGSNADDFIVVSGGLDSHIYGWSSTAPGKPVFDFTVPGERGSVYSIASSHKHSLVASGTSDSIVRLWDIRQEKKPIHRLMGHTDNVRALAIIDDWVVSASSDTTVKLWNLTSGKLFKTFSEHSTSVWSLLLGNTPPDKGTFLSADRSGKVISNSPNGPHTVLMAQSGITSMSLCGNLLYTAASRETLEGYDISQPDPLSKPTVQLEGHVGLRKYRLLNDKRRALTLDTDGNVKMIDITRGIALDFSHKLVDDDSDTELDMILDQVNTPHVLDNWCQVSVRAGQLVVRLDGRSVGNTEVYADELVEVEGLDFSQVVYDDETRINLGQWTLSNLLTALIDHQTTKYNNAATVSDVEDIKEATPPSGTKTPETVPEGADKDTGKVEKKSRLRRIFGLSKKDTPAAAPSTEPAATAPNQQPAAATEPATSTAAEEEEELPKNFAEVFNSAVKLQSFSPMAPSDAPSVTFDPRTRLIISEVGQDAGAPTCVYNQVIGKLSNESEIEALETNLPGWVGEIVLQSNMPPRYLSKIGFLVLFENKEGHEAGHMEKSRLMANPVLRARKIMTYIVKQMIQNKKLPDTALNQRPEDIVELVCKDQVIDPNTMLSVIRTRIWRTGGEVQLHYKILVDILE